MMRTSLEEALKNYAPDADPVLDPLTGQTLNHLPDGVKTTTVPVANPNQSEQAAKRPQDLLVRTNDLNQEVARLYEKRFGWPFDIRYELKDEDP